MSRAHPGLIGVLSCVLLASLCACSKQGGLSPGASYFQGLPQSVVTEALANPTLQQNLEGDTQTQEESVAQAAVSNMIFCREELSVYKSWLATGTPPAIHPGPVPTHPLE